MLRFISRNIWPSLSGLIILIACLANSGIPLRSLHANAAPEFRQWSLSYPSPTGETIRTIIRGNNCFIASANFGDLLYSANGSTWSRLALPETLDFQGSSQGIVALCYAANLFVAVGSDINGNFILTSEDGTSWQLRASNLTDTFTDVLYESGEFIAVAGTKIYTSNNAKDWSVQLITPDLYKITYGGGLWAAVAKNDHIYTSNNLSDWSIVEGRVISFPGQPPSTSNNPLYGSAWIPGDIIHADGRFILVGGHRRQFNGSTYGSVFLWSDDGRFWSHGDTTNNESIYLSVMGVQEQCIYSNNTFYTVGETGIHSSPDGITWSKLHVESDLRSIVDSASETVVVGEKGKILRSTDNINWQQVSANTIEPLNSIFHENEQFIIVGGVEYNLNGVSPRGIILSSNDGMNWNTFLSPNDRKLSSATYGNGLWIVTGDDGSIFSTQDLTNWTDCSRVNTTHDLEYVVYGANRFIAFCKSRDLVYTSTDGIIWESAELTGAQDILAAKFINEKFIIAGDNGLIGTSTDGNIWDFQKISPGVRFSSIMYGKGFYVFSSPTHTAIVDESFNTYSLHESSAGGQVIAYYDGWFINQKLSASRDALNFIDTDEGFPRYYPADFVITSTGHIGITDYEV